MKINTHLKTEMNQLIKISQWVRILLLLPAILITVVIVDIHAYTDSECIDCHDKSSDSRLKIDTMAYQESVHASIFDCIDCHQDVKSNDHISKVGSGRVICSDCHEEQNFHGINSEKQTRPDCKDCHFQHNMLSITESASTVHPDRISKTCLTCHPQESGETTYLSWFPSIRIESHNKQNLGLDYSMDNCIGCHQGRAGHGQTEKLGKVSCSKCHMTENGKSALFGPMHPKADTSSQPGVFAVAVMYQFGFVFMTWVAIRKFLKKRHQSNHSDR